MARSIKPTERYPEKTFVVKEGKKHHAGGGKKFIAGDTVPGRYVNKHNRDKFDEVSSTVVSPTVSEEQKEVMTMDDKKVEVKFKKKKLKDDKGFNVINSATNKKINTKPLTEEEADQLLEDAED